MLRLTHWAPQGSWEGSPLCSSSPGVALSPSATRNQYKQSLGCNLFKKIVNDQTQASVFWKEENCKTMRPDVSSNTAAGASAVFLKKDFPVSSS